MKTLKKIGLFVLLVLLALMIPSGFLFWATFAGLNTVLGFLLFMATIITAVCVGQFAFDLALYLCGSKASIFCGIKTIEVDPE